MPTLEFPLQALATEVEAALHTAADVLGSTVAPHHFGERFRFELGESPRYVWVPTRTREQKPTASRAVDEPRALMSSQEYVEIDCWGTTFAQAWAMRQNVLRALHAVDARLRIENGSWVRPSEGANQAGELYRLEVSLGVPTFDHYVSLDDGTYPAESTVVVEEVEGLLQLTADVDVATTTELTTHTH